MNGVRRVAIAAVETALLLLLVLGNAARYVPPEHIWTLQLLALVAPYVLVSVVVAGAVSVLTKRWKMAALHLGMAIVLTFGVPLLMSKPTQQSPNGFAIGQSTREQAASLRVGTFNTSWVQMGNAAEFYNFFADNPAHVIALQELPLQLPLQTKEGVRGFGEALTGELSSIGLESSLPQSERHLEVAEYVFSRIPLTNPAQVLTLPPNDSLWEWGGVTRAEYRWGKDTIAVYSVHLHSFNGRRPWKQGGAGLLSVEGWVEALGSYRKDFQIRAEQARRLRLWLEKEPFPFIVCGDLNSTPYNWVYGHIASGLQDAFAEQGWGWGNTFPSPLPLFRIDHIMVSAEWEVIAAERSAQSYGSDHLPVFAEIRLR